MGRPNNVMCLLGKISVHYVFKLHLYSTVSLQPYPILLEDGVPTAAASHRPPRLSHASRFAQTSALQAWTDTLDLLPLPPVKQEKGAVRIWTLAWKWRMSWPQNVQWTFVSGYKCPWALITRARCPWTSEFDVHRTFNTKG